jgi:polysaccharide chain length determinant protein (PEP-CTERM system associated)
VIPGKQYKIQQLSEIAWRRKWWILVPCILAGVSMFAASYSMTEIFRSETTILVAAHNAPEDLVGPSVNPRIEERLHGISQQLLSRDSLQAVVEEMNLYPERAQNPDMDVVTRMRADTSVTIEKGDPENQDATTVKIGFQSPSAQEAFSVTDKLTKLFIAKNVKERGEVAQSTGAFLDKQLEDARARLTEGEQRLEAFRSRYAGELPTQLEANVGGVQTADVQLRALQESMRLDVERQTQLERMIADLEKRAANPLAAAPAAGGGVQPSALELELLAARNERREMETRFKPEHPSVIRADRRIRDLETALRNSFQPAPAPTGDNAVALPVLPSPELAERQAEMAIVKGRIRDKERDRQELLQTKAMYQRRIDAQPMRESELATLTRDHETLRLVYADLLRKKENSRMAEQLENDSILADFSIVEPAQLPSSPFAPNRERLVILGLLFGLAFGIGLAAFLEYWDSTLRTEDDIMLALNLPTLASIPMMHSSVDVAKRKRRKLGFGIVTGMFAVVVVAAMTFVR